MLRCHPAAGVCLRGQGVTSQTSTHIRVETNVDTTVVKGSDTPVPVTVMSVMMTGDWSMCSGVCDQLFDLFR